MNEKIKYITSPALFFPHTDDYSFIDINHKNTFLVKDTSFYDLLIFFLSPKFLTDAEKEGFDKHLLQFLIKEGVLIENRYGDENIWNKYNWNRSFYLVFSQMDLQYTEFSSGVHKAQSRLIDERREYIKQYEKAKRYPPLYRPKKLCKREIKLKKYEEDFFDLDLIKYRESQRSFSDKKIPFETFNKILYSSTKNIRIADASKDSGDNYFLLNSFYTWAVIYVYVQGVKNLPRGLYFYDVKNNSLWLIDKKISDEKISKIINGQHWFGGGGFCLFIGAHWERYMWLYRHSRAYINLLIQTGELAQEFIGAAYSLNLEGWLTPAIAESEAASIFGIKERDGVDILLFMKFGLSTDKNPDIKIIRKFKANLDRKKFQRKLHEGFATSDFDLEKDNIFLVRVRGEECLALKTSSGTFSLNMIPDHISLLGLHFFNIDEKERNAIKKKYNIKEDLFRIEFFYHRKKFMERLKKSKNLKRFIKKYDCVVKTKYNREEVFKLFNDWRESFKKRDKRIPSKEFFAQLLDYKNRSRYGIKILYFEINNKLVGLKIVYPHHKNSKLLVMRYKCMNHSYVGLDKFMDLTLTQLFDRYEYFTDGGDFTDEKFKSRFNFKLKQRKPDKIKKIYKVKVLSQK